VSAKDDAQSNPYGHCDQSRQAVEQDELRHGHSGCAGHEEGNESNPGYHATPEDGPVAEAFEPAIEFLEPFPGQKPFEGSDASEASPVPATEVVGDKVAGDN